MNDSEMLEILKEKQKNLHQQIKELEINFVTIEYLKLLLEAEDMIDKWVRYLEAK